MKPAPAPPRRAGARLPGLMLPVGRLLVAATLGGLPGCAADDPAETANATGAPEAGVAAGPGALPAEPDTTEALPPAAPSEARYFGLGRDGRLHARTFELPPSSVTRGEAEAVVRRVVADSGTFPQGVEVLDVFVSGRGVAVVNFTNALLLGHSGGLLAEELTVYSLSHSLVENFPAVAEVRFLVEGQEPDTLAGHLDLRSGFGRAPARLLAETDREPR